MSIPSRSHVTKKNNIIKNHDFYEGLTYWEPNCCTASVNYANDGTRYAVVKGRSENWQGLEQDITSRISEGCEYVVSAFVRASGPSQVVEATLRLESALSNPGYEYQEIGSIPVSNERWVELEATFSYMPKTSLDKVIFYLEGPSRGVELHIRSVVIKQSMPGGNSDTISVTPPSSSQSSNEQHSIIQNPGFEDSLRCWNGNGCEIERCDSINLVVPYSGRYFVRTKNRVQDWNGIKQCITERVHRNCAYQVNGVVRILSSNDSVKVSDVCLTVLKTTQSQKEYIQVDRLEAETGKWTLFQGKFLINGDPSSVVIYLEGPPPGTDILLNSLVVNRVKDVSSSTPPQPVWAESGKFGENIIDDSDLKYGTSKWEKHSDCRLRVEQGLSGRFLVANNRQINTEDWRQIITDKMKLFSTYQVSARVRIGGSDARGPQKVAIKLEVEIDDQPAGRQKQTEWVLAGEVDADRDKWYEIAGSFRIEKKPSSVAVYFHGPPEGVDLHVAGFEIFEVDRKARFGLLKKRTKEIRQREVVLKFRDTSLSGASVKVKQTQNSFPFGSCLYRSNLDNDGFVRFFKENFNWAVFANELKWNHTEQERGKLNYEDAEDMLKFCETNGIHARGHCLFWEVEDNDPNWLTSLSETELSKAVEDRLKGLARFRGKFKHFDVNNEMLHGSFYRGRLGEGARAEMFKKAKDHLDPNALLFLNEYHVEDGKDVRSSPEKYVELIKGLKRQGAEIGGIRIQGHNEAPVGPVICSALDKLGALKIPIWFTELEVSSDNEHVRAEDLEVMVREAFAHPAVEGIMLWGFWELYMTDNKKNNSHLVNAEGQVNEAGKRLTELRKEFMTSVEGHIDDRGEFKFRGYHGTYTVEITTKAKSFSTTFVVEKGNNGLQSISL